MDVTIIDLLGCFIDLVVWVERVRMDCVLELVVSLTLARLYDTGVACARCKGPSRARTRTFVDICMIAATLPIIAGRPMSS